MCLLDQKKQERTQESPNQINKEDEIVVSEQSSRLQLTNRMSAIRKLNEIVNEAIIPEKERKATKVPKGTREIRLKEKKIRSKVKEFRKKIEMG